MFGYVIANPKTLTSEQQARYRSCYCGLCHALSAQHGLLCRATVNFNMTFLILLLSSLTGEAESLLSSNCPVHPFKKHDYFQNEITSYAADMNIILFYAQQSDHWRDDKSVLSLTLVKALKKSFAKAEKAYPEKARLIAESLETLAAIEQQNETNPDIPANCFGHLMGTLFSAPSFEHEHLYPFGAALGRFIYLMDAACDIRQDLKRERYNPLITVPSETHRPLLEHLMAECLDHFNQLPIVRDKELMENILYSGVWTRYTASFNKRGTTDERSL